MLKRTLRQKRAVMATAIAAGLVGLVVALMLATYGSVAAQTPVSGIISSPATWGPPGSTCIVTGSVLVQQGVTLTIEDGVEVRFDQDKGLQVEGTLIAVGTLAQTIVFTSNQTNPAPGDWTFIRFTDTSTSAGFDPQTGAFTGGSILQHCEVRYGGREQVLGTIQLDSSSPFIDHCTIEDNAAKAIYASDPPDLRVTNNDIRKNASGIADSQNSSGGISAIGGTVLVDNNAIAGNHLGGARFVGGGGVWVRAATADITNNTITGNFGPKSLFGGAGGVGAAHSTVTIANSVITGNQGWDDAGGIYIRESAATVSGNTITENEGEGPNAAGGCTSTHKRL